ncbi:MAG: cell division protein FtsA [Sphingomonadaceae bacterium]|nr:cell division protein FtsA [Sphingomonadaceae bacterium]
MAAPRIERLFTAIDVGSSKVAVLIAGQQSDGKLRALGTGVRESNGIKRGVVVDVQAVDQVVRDALEQAEAMAGVEVQQAWISFGGASISSRTVEHGNPFSRGQVEAEDVDELLARIAENLADSGKAVLHARPIFYTVDGMQGVANPEGLYADHLGATVLVVEADRGPVSNLVTAVRAANVDIRDVVASVLASGHACLTAEQRDIGTVLVDIGAHLTKVGLFAGGALIGIATLAAGGDDITDDIASAFAIKRRAARRMKSRYGSAISSPRDHQEQLDLEMAEGDSPAKITRAQLNAVIGKRLDHFVPRIGQMLETLQDGGPTRRQLVLTGAASELRGMADYVQSVLGGSVRMAPPLVMEGLTPAHSGAGYSTMLGLILHAAAPPLDIRPTGNGQVKAEGEGRWWQRLAAMWRRGK